MAVLPTPGSPMSTGLFLVRRRQHLDDAADLLVAADDGVELALPGRLGQVAAVALEGLVLLLGVLRGDPVAAPHLAQRGEQLVALDPDAVGQGQEQVLDRQVLVAHVAAQRCRRRRAGPARVARQRGVARRRRPWAASRGAASHGW